MKNRTYFILSFAGQYTTVLNNCVIPLVKKPSKLINIKPTGTI